MPKVVLVCVRIGLDWTTSVRYADLVQNYFLPNAALFSYLVTAGEILVGVALIVGLFTRFAALMGVLMNLAYLFAGTTSTNPQMVVVGMAVLLAGGIAVSYYGLDTFARPIELKLLRAAHIIPEAQKA